MTKTERVLSGLIVLFVVAAAGTLWGERVVTLFGVVAFVTLVAAAVGFWIGRAFPEE